MDSEEKPNRPVKVYQIDPDLKLNAKQSAFVYEYLKDYNATQAAIRAGYSKRSAKQMGTENLSKPSIKEAIDAGKWHYQYQNGIDADWIRKQRVELFNKCMQLEEVTIRIDGEEVGTGEYVFKESTARAVLADMAKDIGMDAPTKVDINNTGTVKHEHTVKEQMSFDAIRNKVTKQKEKHGMH